MLLEGIKDRHFNIHANYSKCSSSLITHFLLFSFLFTFISYSSFIYLIVSLALPVLALFLWGLLSFSFFFSFFSLLRAVFPY